MTSAVREFLTLDSDQKGQAEKRLVAANACREQVELLPVSFPIAAHGCPNLTRGQNDFPNHFKWRQAPSCASAVREYAVALYSDAEGIPFEELQVRWHRGANYFPMFPDGTC